MKKFLAIFLALVLCFTATLALASCADEEATGATLDDAVEYLKAAYKSDEGKKTTNDYAMPAQVVVEGVTFTITYVVDNAAIKVVYNETKKLYDVDLPDVNTEETPYKLTATIANAAGETKTLEFGRILPVIQKVSGVVTAPVAETPYKLFFDQKNIAQVLFIIAEADGTQFLKTNKDPKVAPDWYVEVEGDGYKIYTVVNNVKMYMYATAAPRAGEEGKFDKAIALSADNASVFKYKADINAWYTTINTTPTAEIANNIDFAIGTYGTFKTLCISETSYYTPENTGVEQFPMQFISKAEGEAMTPSEEIADPTTVTPIADVLAIAGAKEHDKYTVEKYLIEGVITEIKSTTYGNMYVQDAAGNSIYVYGVYDATGETTKEHRYDSFAKKPQVGDTVKLMGIVGKYNDTCQMKNAQLMGHTAKQWSDAEKVAAVKAALTVAAVNSNKVVDLPLTDATHTSVTITWALASSYTGAAATLDATTGKLTVTLQDEAETVTLVATIKSGEVTDNKEITVNIAKKPTVIPQLVATAPTAGTGYYIGVSYNGAYNFLTGKIGNAEYRLAFSDVVANATAFELEATTGGFYIKTTVDGATKYLNIVVNGTHVNNLYQDTAASVWVWNDTYKTLTVNVPEKGEYAITNTGHANVEAKAVTETSNKAQFFTLVDASTITDADRVAHEKAELNIETNFAVDGEVVLPTAGKLYGNVVITWAVEANNGALKIEEGKLIATPQATETTVKVTATLKIGETVTDTKEFNVTVAKKVVLVPVLVTAPEAGKKYYIGLVYDGEYNFLTGKTANANYRFAFTRVFDDMVVFELEATTGGFYVKTTVGGATKYINIVISGDYVNSLYQDTASSVWVWSDTYNTLTVTVPGKGEYALTQTGTYDNVEAKTVSTTGVKAQFFTIVDESTITDADRVAQEKANLTVETDIVSAGNVTLPTAGSTYENVTFTWSVATNNYVTLNGNVLTVVLPNADTTVTLTATIALGNETATKTFTLNLKAPNPTPIATVLSENASLAAGATSAKGYIVEGVIYVLANSTYGNAYIVDTNGDTIYIYGLYVDGTSYKDYTGTKVVKGDYVKVYSTVNNYQGTLQLKNAEIISTTAAADVVLNDNQKAVFAADALTVSTDKISATGDTNLTTSNATYGATITWAVSANDCATVTGGVLTVATLPTADTKITLTATVTVGTANVTKTFDVTIAAPLAAGTTSVKKTAVEINNTKAITGGATATLDSNTSVTFNKGEIGTNPKLNNSNILLYQNNSGKNAGNGMTFKVGSGYKLTKIILTITANGQNANNATNVKIEGGTVSTDADGNVIITANEGVTEITITLTGTNKNQDRMWIDAIEVQYASTTNA